MTKKKKITILTLLIATGLLLILGSTYALWQLTRVQNDTNSLAAACLDIDLQGMNSGISLENAWPMDNYEAISNLEGYSFKVINHCDEPINYLIGLEDTTSSNKMNLSSLNISLDDAVLGNIASRNNVDNNSSKKALGNNTVLGNDYNIHNVKIWINDSASLENSGKSFSSKIFITGGQNISGDIAMTSEDCFTVNSDGKITGYDFSCGEDVVVPTKVDGKNVTGVATDAFRKLNAITDADLVVLQNKSTYAVKAILFDDSKKGLADLYFDQGMDKLYDAEMWGIPSYEYIDLDDYANLDLNDYDINYYTFSPVMRQRDTEGRNIDATTANIIGYLKPSGVDSDSMPIGDVKVFINDSDNLQTIKSLLGNFIYQLVSRESTITYIDSADVSLLSQGYQPIYYKLLIWTDDSSGEIKDGLGINTIDFSKASYLNKIDSYAFAISKDLSITNDEVLDLRRLQGLNFGYNTSAIDIGAAAFMFADLEDLTLYTTYTSNDGMPFIGADIQNLTYKVADGVLEPSSTPTTVFNISYNASLTNLANVGNLVLDNKIESVPSYMFGKNCTLSTSLKGVLPMSAFPMCETISNAGLPEGITEIGAGAFESLNQSDFTIPSTVTKIERNAFRDFKGTLHIQRTSANFYANVTLDNWWVNSSATLNFNS